MHAYENVRHAFTGNVKSDFTEKLYTFVAIQADQTIDTAAAGGQIMGVAYENPKATQPCRVVDGGYAFIKLGGTVAAGDAIEVGANGTAVKATTGTVVGICAVGGAVGDIGTIRLA